MGDTTRNVVAQGLLAPFRRDQKNDFANGTGAALIVANVRQILGMREGSLPWDSARGSKLYLLRHRNPDATTHELARVYVIEALAKWETRARVKTARMVVDGRQRRIDVLFDVTSVTGDVVLADQKTSVSLGG
ncbi:MAG: hypothetical protein HOW73_43095 [Polyangiaceae bacterium]|nr:hypothetical protein [Polyangiaceae bacterium]